MLKPLLLSLLLVLGGQAPDRRLPPVDECASDPAFAAFRARLAVAVEHRDRDHLLAVVADDIKVDLGGGAGRDHFARTWELERPENSALWGELGEVLRLGCVRLEDGEFLAPSLFLQMGDQADPLEVMIATVPGAAMHAAANIDSPIVANLDWDVLAVGDYNWPDPWVPVALADGRRGFVRLEHVRSPIDYRAAFRRIDGRWRMTAFIAGD